MRLTQLNTVYISSQSTHLQQQFFASSAAEKNAAENELTDSKYTLFNNCAKSHNSHYAHFIWNYFNFIHAETISQ